MTDLKTVGRDASLHEKTVQNPKRVKVRKNHKPGTSDSQNGDVVVEMFFSDRYDIIARFIRGKEKGVGGIRATPGREYLVEEVPHNRAGFLIRKYFSRAGFHTRVETNDLTKQARLFVSYSH